MRQIASDEARSGVMVQWLVNASKIVDAYLKHLPVYIIGAKKVV